MKNKIIILLVTVFLYSCDVYYEGTITQKIHHPQTIMYTFNGKFMQPIIQPERFCLILQNKDNMYEVCLSRNVWDTCKIGQYFINK